MIQKLNSKETKELNNSWDLDSNFLYWEWVETETYIDLAAVEIVWPHGNIGKKEDKRETKIALI